MKLTVRLVEPEAEYVADTDARDLRAFERMGRSLIPELPKTGTLKEITSAMPMTYTAFLAWHALKRAKTLELAWPVFEARLVETSVESGDSDVDVDPIPTAVTRD